MNILGTGLLILLAAGCVTCGRFPRSRRGIYQGAAQDFLNNETQLAMEAEVALRATSEASNDEAEMSREAAENKVEEKSQESREDNGGICSMITPLTNLVEKVIAMFPVVGPFLKKLVSFAEKMLCNKNAGIA